MADNNELSQESRESLHRTQAIEHTHKLHGRVVDELLVLNGAFGDLYATIDESSALIFRANAILGRRAKPG